MNASSTHSNVSLQSGGSADDGTMIIEQNGRKVRVRKVKRKDAHMLGLKQVSLPPGAEGTGTGAGGAAMMTSGSAKESAHGETMPRRRIVVKRMPRRHSAYAGAAKDFSSDDEEVDDTDAASNDGSTDPAAATVATTRTVSSTEASLSSQEEANLASDNPTFQNVKPFARRGSVGGFTAAAPSAKARAAASSAAAMKNMNDHNVQSGASDDSTMMMNNNNAPQQQRPVMNRRGSVGSNIVSTARSFVPTPNTGEEEDGCVLVSRTYYAKPVFQARFRLPVVLIQAWARGCLQRAVYHKKMAVIMTRRKHAASIVLQRRLHAWLTRTKYLRVRQHVRNGGAWDKALTGWSLGCRTDVESVPKAFSARMRRRASVAW